VLANARRIYLLAGEVEAGSSVRLESRRSALPRVGHADLWMVVRTETLDWDEHTHRQLAAMIARWRSTSNRLVGVQVDFDAETRGLERYAAFLRDMRRRLPEGLKLGTTGLLDWSANGDPRGLDALAGAIDEAVLQIYQGRRVIPGYETYLARLDRMKIPFRIGLLQGGEWRAPRALAANPNFQGYVVFLRNPE
jgi:hypothetical protein